jgi:hypothetical protein
VRSGSALLAIFTGTVYRRTGHDSSLLPPAHCLDKNKAIDSGIAGDGQPSSRASLLPLISLHNLLI